MTFNNLLNFICTRSLIEHSIIYFKFRILSEHGKYNPNYPLPIGPYCNMFVQIPILASIFASFTPPKMFTMLVEVGTYVLKLYISCSLLWMHIRSLNLRMIPWVHKEYRAFHSWSLKWQPQSAIFFTSSIPILISSYILVQCA